MSEGARIGFAVRAWREHRGMSPVDLAGAADVSRHVVLGVELGKRRPPFKTLVKLADGLDVPVEYLSRGRLPVPREGYDPMDGAGYA